MSPYLATVQVLFTISYRPDITTAHVIRYNCDLYDITCVDVFEGYKCDLMLYAKKNA
ncbi:MAG: head-tail adaptor protein [Clostridium sp.]|nr:head-tail adaptor protein [Clostridium sp.]